MTEKQLKDALAMKENIDRLKGQADNLREMRKKGNAWGILDYFIEMPLFDPSLRIDKKKFLDDLLDKELAAAKRIIQKLEKDFSEL